MARLDSTILHEIARVIQVRAKVPARVRVLKREFQITYLEDHQQRIEEALRRHDGDRLNMLFGQLASKVKYQLLRRIPTPERKPAPARATRRATRKPKTKTKTARKRARSR